MTSEAKNGSTSILDSEVVVIGNISGQGDVELRGRLQGNLRLEGRLVVARGATVVGNVDASSVIVAGSVQGDIEAQEGIEIQGHGSVEGNMVAPRIGIETGAQVRGLLTTAARSTKTQARASSEEVHLQPRRVVEKPPEPELAPAEGLIEPEEVSDAEADSDEDDLESESVATRVGDDSGPLRARRRRRRRRKRPETALTPAAPWPEAVSPQERTSASSSPNDDGPPRPPAFQKGVQAQRRR